MKGSRYCEHHSGLEIERLVADFLAGSVGSTVVAIPRPEAPLGLDREVMEPLGRAICELNPTICGQPRKEPRPCGVRGKHDELVIAETLLQTDGASRGLVWFCARR